MYNYYWSHVWSELGMEVWCSSRDLSIAFSSSKCTGRPEGEQLAEIIQIMSNVRRICAGLWQQQQHKGVIQQCPCTKCFSAVFPKCCYSLAHDILHFLPLCQSVPFIRFSGSELLSPFSLEAVEQPDWPHRWWNLTFLFLHYLLSSANISPPQFKSHFIMFEWWKWLFLTWGGCRKIDQLLKQVYEKWLFSLPLRISSYFFSPGGNNK